MKRELMVLMLWAVCWQGAARATADVLWFADHETGNLTQWQGTWISGTATANVSTTVKRAGTYSTALTITNANGSGTEPGVRMARVGTTATPGALPNSAYYSTWYYFPQLVTPAQWWNVFQYKRVWSNGQSSDPVLTVNIDNRANGNMFFYLYNHVGNDGNYNTSGVGVKASSGIDIPLGQWVHFECNYVWATSYTGRIRCWQNGRQIWDVQNIKTEYAYGSPSNPRQWTVNNYSNNTNPATHTLYIDDAVISSTRVWEDITACMMP